VCDGTLNLPAHAGSGGVNSWGVCINFTTPYTHLSGNNLIVEMINKSATSISHFDDYCLNDVGATTMRVFALDKAAASGTVGSNQGLIMRLTGAPLTSQECLLYYKFDRGLTDNLAINYGSASLDSSLQKGSAGPTSPWVKPGKYGPAMLRGSSNTSSTNFAYCDTGHKAGFKGDLTLHWWMKERVAVGTGLSYLFGGMGSFRCFTNGVAGTSLWVRAFNATTVNIVMPTVGATIQTRARATGGVCVSCVVKTVSGTTTAQWYVDGNPHGSAQTLSQPPDVAASTSSYKIGKHTSNTSSSVYDIDEFRLCNFAATPAQIKQWCSAPTAASGAFGGACRIELGSTGGTPTVGNPSYAHTIKFNPPKNSPVLFVVGVTPTLPFDMGIAFPALSGCKWYASFDVGLVLNVNGQVTIPGGIPNNPIFAGIHVDTQVLHASLTKGFDQSNAVSHVIEIN